MKSYVMVAGTTFGLLAPVHVWRIVEEPHALSLVAWRVVRRSRP